VEVLRRFGGKFIIFKVEEYAMEMDIKNKGYMIHTIKTVYTTIYLKEQQ
jgi:hypothetical protein